MSKDFTRTVETMTVTAEKVFYKDDELHHEELPTFTFYEKLNDKQLNKHYETIITPGETLAIKNIKTDKIKYRISLDDFIKYGEQI